MTTHSRCAKSKVQVEVQLPIIFSQLYYKSYQLKKISSSFDWMRTEIRLERLPEGELTKTLFHICLLIIITCFTLKQVRWFNFHTLFLNIFIDIINISYFQLCDAHAQARKPPKHLKRKDLSLMGEYVINELPALLNGIQYEGILYKFMLHPTLKTGNSNGNKQREAMTRLLDHMRRQYLPNAIYTTALCDIFDVEIPIALINDDTLLTHSSDSSSDVNIDTSNGLEESSRSISNTLVVLWLTLISQVCYILFLHIVSSIRRSFFLFICSLLC